MLPILRTMAEAEQDFQISPGDSLTTEQYEQAKSQIVEDLKAWIKPLHALVVGPGLGRDPLVLSCAMAAVSAARDRDLPVVLDGDALWALNDDLDIIQGYTRAVLTPNVVEYRRLYLSVAASLENPEVEPLEDAERDPEDNEKMRLELPAASSSSSSKHPTNSQNPLALSNPVVLPSDDESIWNPRSVKTIAAALGGVTIIRKGSSDVISDGRRTIQCNRSGGLRRCGGQGDILAGVIGTILGWNYGSQSGYENAEKIRKREGHRFTASRTMLAAWGASNLTREASHRAYAEHHRGVTTSHILNHIAPAFYDLCEHYTSESESSDPNYLSELL